MKDPVELHHPDLGATITVPKSAAWVHLENGWVHAADAAAVAPTSDAEAAPEDEPYDDEEGES